MAASGFAALHGHNVALVTNHTATVGKRHLADLLFAEKRLKLVALFGPEHGIRGQADAGAPVGNTHDEKTGVPVYSLYGQVRRPTTRQLQGCDVLVYDIQDVGARFYTYISTLGLCMQSAAEARIPFVVLDRPNPLGGSKIEGPVLERGNESFVGQYPIPIRYGLTPGELALMIRGEKWLPGLENLDLTVVKMRGWHRKMLWPQTTLPWIPPSPNIPDFETAVAYPGTCLFEATTASEGRGTPSPFLNMGTQGIDPEIMSSQLNSLGLAGVRFAPARFVPRSIPGKSATPKLKDQPLAGITVSVTDPESYDSVATGLEILTAFYSSVPANAKPAFFRPDSMARLVGNRSLVTQLQRGVTVKDIVSSWTLSLEKFDKARASYLLYK